MWTTEDKAIFKGKGITEKQVNDQLKRFEVGFPYLDLTDVATIENRGILRLQNTEEEEAIQEWETYRLSTERKEILKFVPASGAASRMFKDLFEFLTSEREEPTTTFEIKFFQHLKEFAFYSALNDTCLHLYTKDIPSLLMEKQYKNIVQSLLGTEGLNYGKLPKGLLLFHHYTQGNRTPVEEHLVEGALYAADSEDEVHLLFTVSTEHRALFEALLKEKTVTYEEQLQKKFHVSFSEQKSSTDTIAANAENQAFRENGELVFRPGGHGALIENLNDLDADIIFIKNIDNVVPDSLKTDTVRYKKIIAGLLVKLQKQVFAYLHLLDRGNYTEEDIKQIFCFLQEELQVQYPESWEREDLKTQALHTYQVLHRPLRICGMVKNIGEPGGGPFWVKDKQGITTLQIIESSQINMQSPIQRTMFEGGTHFNPVDLVCATKDYKGHKFLLTNFVDEETGFISSKSKNGQELKALELPGLWNGAMSKWNTLFVEVPLSTFNPVKTVNDLLRKEHQ